MKVRLPDFKVYGSGVAPQPRQRPMSSTEHVQAALQFSNAMMGMSPNEATQYKQAVAAHLAAAEAAKQQEIYDAGVASATEFQNPAGPGWRAILGMGGRT